MCISFKTSYLYSITHKYRPITSICECNQPGATHLKRNITRFSRKYNAISVLKILFFSGSIQYFKAVAHIVNCKVELLHGLQQNPRDTEGSRRINREILASFIRSPVYIYFMPDHTYSNKTSLLLDNHLG